MITELFPKTKRIKLFLFLFFSVGINAQVGVGTTSPAAALDVTSTNDGLLVPRVALTMTTAASPLTAPTTSEVIYNTATVADVTPGFYYWDGTKWVRLLSGTNNYWSTTGNAATTAATNFIGTTDAVDFITKTNSVERTRVTSAGNVGIGSNAPNSLLEVGSSTSGVTAAITTKTSTLVNAYNAATFGNYNGGVLQSTYPGGLTGQMFNIAATGSNAGNWPSQIAFHTRTNGGTDTNEKMRITSSGAVGIGTTAPNGALEVNATANNYGFVPPRVALTASNATTPVANPQTGAIVAGTIVYNTATAGVAPNNVGPGLYYWDGSKWVAFAGAPGGLDWTLTGNTATIPGSYASPGMHYIGTSDANDLHISTNNSPRIEIASGGNTGIGAAATGVDLVNINNSNASNTRGLLVNNSTTSAGARGISIVQSGTNTGSAALVANNTNSATDGLGAIIAGQNLGLVSLTNSAISANGRDYGLASFGKNTTTGIGVAGVGQGLTSASSFFGFGAGVAATGTNLGLSSFATNTTGDRNAARFNALNSTATLADDPSASLAGTATNVDVTGGGVNRNVTYGGYFSSGSTSAYAYVGATLSAAVSGSTNYKIIGPGTVSTIVSSQNEEEPKKVMFAPEAPEVLFEDYGVGQLNNGQVTITIDPIFSKNIFVDDNHPLKVFIQLEGDCNGVFVTNKSKNSFTVKELAGGTSNVKFAWHIVGNRANERDNHGEVIYQSLRYPDAPKALSSPELKQVEHQILKD